MMNLLHAHAFEIGIRLIPAIFILGSIAYFKHLYRESR